ncbi:helix-turn-helix domain-containing protein [Bordetella sp. 02P26C-1]|uniref:helix-turn-helix domain-containing protein n=1 Tax=Bordetella sp. 02P26C-1 TaxID=2683195 RepID=UPI00135273B0|nr:helix-turn-helix domain-containing protein [Bordetella sp. 02P26C-1]MVW78077.1 hypothetical protein [Bordetella sp. 02P26C-1]
MSIKAMNWGWTLSLEPTAKVILLALADSADDQGQSWLKVKTIAAKCNLSERTIRRWINKFVQINLLEVTKRFDPNGRQTSNVYQLAVDKYPDNLSSLTEPCQPPSATEVTPAMTKSCPGELDTAVSDLEPPVNPSFKSPPQPTFALSFPRGLSEAEVLAIKEVIPSHPSSQVLLDELQGAMNAGVIRSSRVSWFRAILKKSRAGSFYPTYAQNVAANSSRQAMPQNEVQPQATSKAEGRRRLEELKLMLLPPTRKQA